MSSSSNGRVSIAHANTPPQPVGINRLYGRVQEAIKTTRNPADLSDAELQDVLALVCKLYSERWQDGAKFAAFGPFQSDAAITATDGAVTASAILDAVSVEIFELGMWRTWGTAG